MLSPNVFQHVHVHIQASIPTSQLKSFDIINSQARAYWIGYAHKLTHTIGALLL